MAKITPLRCFFFILCIFIVFVIYISTLLQDIIDIGHRNTKNPCDEVQPFPGKYHEHIHWFVQVSDIHISTFYDKKRGTDLQILNEYLKSTIKPEVVIVTGDLTDSKLEDKFGSRQYESEWKEYRQAIDDTHILNYTVWLDMRGNHDAFSVPSYDSPLNYYRRYAIQGRQQNRHYLYKHQTPEGDSFSFIGFDASPSPGPRRPFNFFGRLLEGDISSLRQLRDEAGKSNKTFWFGHYPTSTISSPEPGIRTLIGEINSGGYYFCGHLHTLLDWVPRMHTRAKSNFLELELGDWKDYRRFRVFAVDHDLFSFSDVTFEQWPIIVITNPKNAYYNQPGEEPLGRTRLSTHIRMLLFSPVPIEYASVSIDGVILGNPVPAEPNTKTASQGESVAAARENGGALYVIEWRASNYLHGLHTISVTARDSVGRERTLTQPFSLDNTRLEFDWLPRYVLMVDHIFLCKSLFLTSVICYLLPLLVLRFVNFQVETSFSGGSCIGCLCRLLQTWLRRLSLLARTDSLFRPLVAYLIYICVGPWFIGDIIEGYIGVMCVHGLYVNGAYIPGTLTYIYGFFQVVTFNVPLTLYLARATDLSLSAHKHQSISHPDHDNRIPYHTLHPDCDTNKASHLSTMSVRHNNTMSVRHNNIGKSFLTPILDALGWLSANWVFLVLLVWQLNLAYFGVCRAYGMIAFLLGPVRTWAIPFAVYLRSLAVNRSGTSNTRGLCISVEQSSPFKHEAMN